MHAIITLPGYPSMSMLTYCMRLATVIALSWFPLAEAQNYDASLAGHLPPWQAGPQSTCAINATTLHKL